MKRLTAYALTAAAALATAGTIPSTANAAVNTYNFSAGGGRVIMVTGNNRMDFNNILNQIPGVNFSPDCQPVFPNYPGDMLPDNSLPMPELPSPDYPMPDYPDNSLPTPELPSPELPDNSLPTPDQPTPELPDNSLPTPDQPSDENQDEAVGAVLKLVNEERAKAGLPALTLHAGATRAAQQRAGEIETSFSHTRPDGSNFTTALAAAGVSYRAAGENIAYGQKSAKQVMQDWMNSAGHRANIMNANYSSIGIGHYKNAAGVDYWTQLFIN